MNDSAFLLPFAALGAYLVGAAIGGALVWTNAPPAGGDLWPYIRFGATLVGGVVGGAIGAILVVLSILLLVGILSLVSWVINR